MKIIAYIKIIRPLNFLFVILAVLFGAFYRSSVEVSYSHPAFYYIPILAAISAALISAAGYTLNDFFDVNIDKINCPHRPLPSGIISGISAKRYAIILFISGNLLCLFLFNPAMSALALLNSLILWLYAQKGKRLVFISNLIVAFATASTFIYGGFANHNLKNAIFVFSCAFIYTLIRELIKDIEDMKGDKKADSRTLPIIWGSKATLIIALILSLAFTICIHLGLNNFYTITYYYLILIFVCLFILLDLTILISTRSNKFFSFSSKAMKVNMLIFLIILWIGQ
ncbi:MAG: geranylgeranylglycerol-phosphate geranylgeranyltransferase [Candidatus Cloacimonadota bacterium]|nr:geranylgeranylglycerol-phosphate geranylgeranyltransferase [Candidatus Cloacimonadota bacterium]